MLSYHEMQSQASLWTRCPVNDLYVEPLDLASALAAEDGFAPGISKEAVYDTMENQNIRKLELRIKRWKTSGWRFA